MKQVLQNMKSGRFELVDVPAPLGRSGHLLVETKSSLISAGTERMLIEFGRAGWIRRIRDQPDRVKQVADKVRAEGLLSAWEAVQAKLHRDMPMGYANAGRVLDVGPGVEGWRPGDRILSNGPHAETVLAPARLSVRIPDDVPDDHAPFAVLAAIGLQGIRLAAPTLGESFAVFGLGLVGLLTAQLLRSSGCRVFGVDPNPLRRELAGRWGVVAVPPDSTEHAMDWTAGRGIDGAILATATDSPMPLRQAAALCRRRGRIVLTGVAGSEISRDLFYKKELSFQVSCSYGPGRYDRSYETQGHDYPLGEVRWTAQRNMEAALEAMRAGSLEVGPLISHRFPFGQIQEAYAELLGGASLGIILEYGSPAAAARVPTVRTADPRPARPARPAASVSASLSVSIIGAGEFATRVLLPEIKRGNVRLATVASQSGMSAASAARRFGFEEAASETLPAMKATAERHAVFVATRHDSHAELAVEALDRGHAVWVEKPLALSASQLREVIKAYERARARGGEPCLMVGFNRRFSPMVTTLRRRLTEVAGPLEFRYLVNAGTLDETSWILDAQLGGGRVVGECCHFIDLLRFLAGSPITSLHAVRSGAQGVRLVVEMGSQATGSIDYVSGGSRRFPKERLEVFAGGKVWVLDNFRSLREYPGQSLWSAFSSARSWLKPPQKGHPEAVAAFLAAASLGQPAPIPPDESFEVTDWTLEAARQIA